MILQSPSGHYDTKCQKFLSHCTLASMGDVFCHATRACKDEGGFSRWQFIGCIQRTYIQAAAVAGDLSLIHAGEDSASTPKDLGVSPNQIKEAEAIEKCTQLIDDLNQDGFVVLGLSGGQYRQLAQLKEAAASLTAGMDALKYDRYAYRRHNKNWVMGITEISGLIERLSIHC